MLENFNFDQAFLDDEVEVDTQKQDAQGGQPISEVVENRRSKSPPPSKEDYLLQLMLLEQQKKKRYLRTPPQQDGERIKEQQ